MSSRIMILTTQLAMDAIRKSGRVRITAESIASRPVYGVPIFNGRDADNK